MVSYFNVSVTGDGLHGLEAALEDQGFSTWGCLGTEIPGADGTEVGTGSQNTADILAGCNETKTAAEVADMYVLNGFVDWFLPSKDELNLLYLQRNVVGGFESVIYWSSSEIDSESAWFHTMNAGNIGSLGKTSVVVVRPIRAF